MSHYFSEQQDSAMKYYDIEINLFGDVFNIVSAPGIFSAKHLDKGTELLIKNAVVEKGWRVLDLGCGYGPVGIAIARKYPGTTVVMSDINKRAVKMSRLNVDTMGLDNAEVVHSDKFEHISGKFDTVLLNPPQTAGKQVCFDMIEGSREHIKKGGLLQVVARHNKGGKTLSDKMKDVFGNVEDAAKKGGFRVYVSTRDS